jgi:hypothetical protein
MEAVKTDYHKIQTVYMRDPATKHKALLEGHFSLPEFEYLKDRPWTWTEKIDGTNVRVECGIFRESVEFKGRTDDAQLHAKLFDHLRATFEPDRLREVFPPVEGPEGDPVVVLYGEGYGAKIQKGGGNYLAGRCGFILFDVRVGRWWLGREAVADVATKLQVPVVPEIGRGSLLEAVEYVRAGMPSVVAEGRCIAEGLVMRPAVELFGRNGDRIIAKIKHRDFAREPKS